MPSSSATKSPAAARKLRRPLNLRERRLLALTAWVLAIIAAIGVAKKFSENKREHREIQAAIADQQATLDTEADIRQRLEEHAKRMESTKTIDVSELQTLVDGYARTIRLIPESVTPKTETKGSIQIFSVRLVFRNATIDRLLLFEDKLRGSKIPLTVTTTRLDSSRDGTITATYNVATYRMNNRTAAAPAATANAKTAGKRQPALASTPAQTTPRRPI